MQELPSNSKCPPLHLKEALSVAIIHSNNCKFCVGKVMLSRIGYGRDQSALVLDFKSAADLASPAGTSSARRRSSGRSRYWRVARCGSSSLNGRKAVSLRNRGLCPALRSAGSFVFAANVFETATHRPRNEELRGGGRPIESMKRARKATPPAAAQSDATLI